MFMFSLKGIYWGSSWKASHRQEQKWSGLNVIICHMTSTSIQAFDWTLSICWIGCNRYAALAAGRYYVSERTSFAAHQHYGGKSCSVRMLNYQDICRDLTNVQLPKHISQTIFLCPSREIEILCPGYTHMQRAQPIRWSHWILRCISVEFVLNYILLKAR